MTVDKMDALKLNDREQQLYQDIFHSCDVDGTGKVSGNRANDLLRTTGLSQDILNQITGLCGAKRLGMFGRSQFYVALKLVAVAQNHLPLSLESIASDVPLPEFTSQQENVAQTVTDIEQDAAAGDSGKTIPVVQTTGQLPPPPAKKHSRNLSGQYRGVTGQPPEGVQQYPAEPQIQDNARCDSPPNSKSPVFSPKQSPPISPPSRDSKDVTQQAVVTNNSTEEKSLHSIGWARFGGDELTGNNIALVWVHYKNMKTEMDFSTSGYIGLMRPGVYVKKSWEDLEGHSIDSSSLSSEAESLDDVWTISQEQRDYYITQFKIMQPDVTGVIKGNIAKEFFEKSRLPIQELSKIWQLSDFNKDGALSLEEFCTAMHLVVLKRNDVELPNHLPTSLMPYSTLINDEPFASDLPPGSTIKRASPLSPSASQWSTAFLSDSSSDLSSPVIKPVNFEVNPVPHDPDANIIHPVALRISPEGHTYSSLDSQEDRLRTTSDPVNYETNHDSPDILTPSKPRSNTESHSTEPISPLNKLHGSLQGRPRPVPKKSSSASIPGQLQPPPAMSPSEVVSGSEETVNVPVCRDLSSPTETAPSPSVQGSAPPQLPPRPTMHNRSISVDLKLKIDGGLMPPPAVPPRISPKDGKKGNEKLTFDAVDSDRLSQTDPARLKRFEPIESQEVLNVINTSDVVERKVFSGQSTLERHRRAKSLDFHRISVNSNNPEEVQDIDQTESVSSVQEEKTLKEPRDLMEAENLLVDGEKGEVTAVVEKPRQNSIALRKGSRDKRDVQMALRTHRERNTMLGRVNSELNQELQEVMEQRIALEIQLEHLRPFSS